MKNKPLEMRTDLTVMENLGIRLYGKLPPVISAIIANAWDADAESVRISLPQGDIDDGSKIVIEDTGHGMSYDDIVDLYLRIGRKRRDEESTDRTPKGRHVIGRKGIGKLSVFGVAKRVEVKTVRNGKMNVFRMDIDDILEQARQSGRYSPEAIKTEEDTNRADGTTVTMTALKRQNRIDPKDVKRSIAKHFSIIGEGFQINVNGEDILPSDKFRPSDMEDVWEIKDEPVSEDRPEWIVSGWIGAAKSPLDEEDRGLAIMTRGKLVQMHTMFEIKSGGISYITGEIDAPFLDMETDLTSANRQSLIWDEPESIALMEWGAKRLGTISAELSRRRKDRREKALREDSGLKSWLSSLEKPEQKIADRIIGVITSSDRLDDECRRKIAYYIMDSFDHKTFSYMVASLDDQADPVALLEIFREWDVIEAREITRIVKGRLDAIRQLGRYIDQGSSKIPALYEYIKKWPWILDPAWTKWQDEVRCSELLRREYPDDKLDEADRRIDFISIGVGDTIHIVELKRPGYSVSSKDIDQLTRYMIFVHETISNITSRGYNNVAGYIVAGKISEDELTQIRIREAKPFRRYVKMYDDLIVVARQLHSEFEDMIRDRKPERAVQGRATRVRVARG